MFLHLLPCLYRHRAESSTEELSPQWTDPIDEEHPVEVIDLVEDHPGKETTTPDRYPFSTQCLESGDDRLRTNDLFTDVRDAQTPLLTDVFP